MKKDYFFMLLMSLMFITPNAFAQSNGFDCSTLDPDIITTEIDLCEPGGEVTLEANVNVGDEIFWYDSDTITTEPIGKGSELDLGFIDESVSYWVTEGKFEVDSMSGQGMPAPSGEADFQMASSWGLLFTVEDENLVLYSVDVYPEDSGDLEIELVDQHGTVIETHIESVPASPSSPITIDLNFDDLNLEPGTGYKLVTDVSTMS